MRTAVHEACSRCRFAPLVHPEWRLVRFVATLPERLGNQEFVALLEGAAELAAESAVIDAERGIGVVFIVYGA